MLHMARTRTMDALSEDHMFSTLHLGLPPPYAFNDTVIRCLFRNLKFHLGRIIRTSRGVKIALSDIVERTFVSSQLQNTQLPVLTRRWANLCSAVF